MHRTLAWIIPLDSQGSVTPPIYYPPGTWGPNDPRPGWGLPMPPPGIWGGGPFPTPPIAPGGTTPPWGVNIPPGTWGPNDPRPGWGLPPDQPIPGWGAGFPTPPIHVPPPPPDIPPPAAEPPNAESGWVLAYHYDKQSYQWYQLPAAR